MSGLSQTTVSAQVVERVASDVGAWKRVEVSGGEERLRQSAASGIRAPHLAYGIWLLLLQCSQALTDTQLATTGREEHDDTACSTPTLQLESTPAFRLRGWGATDKFPHTA